MSKEVDFFTVEPVSMFIKDDTSVNVKRIISNYYHVTQSDNPNCKLHYLLGYLDNCSGPGVPSFSPKDLRDLFCWVNVFEIKAYKKDDVLPFN